MCPNQGSNPKSFGIEDDVSTILRHPARAKTTFYYYFLKTEVEHQK